jgi:hypothetical protein
MPYSNLRCTPILKGHSQREKKNVATPYIPLPIPVLLF